MSVELFMYLASVTGHLKAALLITSILAGSVSSIFLTILSPDSTYGHSQSRLVFHRKVLTISMAGLFTACLIPGAKTLYLMAGAAYGKEAIQSETAVKVKKIIDSQLDKILEELGQK